MKKSLLIPLLLFLSSIIGFGQSNIRRVDFKNFTYSPYCSDTSAQIEPGTKPENFKVKNGEFKKTGGEFDLNFEIYGIIYGDITGDKKEEAVILTTCNTGGQAYFTEGFIYTLNHGKTSFLSRIAGGDRGKGGIFGVKIVKGLLIVERNEGTSDCCAERIITTKYGWNGTKLLKRDKAQSRKANTP